MRISCRLCDEFEIPHFPLNGADLLIYHLSVYYMHIYQDKASCNRAHIQALRFFGNHGSNITSRIYRIHIYFVAV